MGLPLVHMATSEPPDRYVLCGALIGAPTFDSTTGIEDVTCRECLRLLAPTDGVGEGGPAPSPAPGAAVGAGPMSGTRLSRHAIPHDFEVQPVSCPGELPR